MIKDLDTGKEIKPRIVNVKTVKDQSQGITFQRADIKILSKILIYAPPSIEKALIGLREKFPDVEFSMFGSAHWNAEKGFLEVDEEFVIPAQQVSYAHIDYLEDPGMKYDLIIHKHPDGCTSFSPTDEEFINANFRHSLLWHKGSFVMATTTIFYEAYDTNIRLPAKVLTDKNIGVVPDGALDKIRVMDTPEDFHIGGIGGPYSRGSKRQRGEQFGSLGVSHTGRSSFPDYGGSSHRMTDEAMLEAMLCGGGEDGGLSGFEDVSDDVERMGGFIDDETDMDDRVEMDEIMRDLGCD